MVEYLYDAIRASAGEDAVIMSQLTIDGEDITEGCFFMLHLNEENALHIAGEYSNGLWYFTIPGELTRGLKGHFEYCIYKDSNALCFKEAIYFV